MVKKYLELISFLAAIPVLIYLSLLIYVGFKAEVNQSRGADVILVLGARSYIDGKYNPCLVARVDHAVELYNLQLAPKIIFSGGTDTEDGTNEAETMKKIAAEKGVPEWAILVENKSTSTYENFKLSKNIIDDAGFKSVIVVTEPFHVARSELVGQKLGYNQSFSPTKDSSCWKDNKYFSKYFLKEPLALIAYKLQNKL